jgi:16S rRNA (guanine527-N7)-methyltransferase
MTKELLAKQAHQLEQGIALMGIDLNDRQCTLLLDYLRLLNTWNQAYNLTAVRNREQHVSRHLLDSLALLPFLCGTEKLSADVSASATASGSKVTDCPVYLDVGTGPGLPGIPLAIAMPHSHWFLVDSNSKKTRFLTHCKMDLPVNNIEVVHSRIEDFQPPEGCHISGITSRAFATLKTFVDCTHQLMSSAHDAPVQTRLYAMKGAYPKNEVSELPINYKIQHLERLNIPDCDGQRHLLVLTKVEGGNSL